jgi:hypothetical protein
MKLRKIHLFLILLIILLFSKLGLVVREGQTAHTLDIGDGLYLECAPEGESVMKDTPAPINLTNPVIQAIIGIAIAIIVGFIIKKLM